MGVDLIFEKCPNCSANLKFIPGSEMGQCEFCGSSFVISDHKSKMDIAGTSDTNVMEFNNEWAQKISEIALTRFQKQHKIDLSEDSIAMERIVDASRKVAMELEEQDKSTMNIPFIYANSNGPLHICEEYSRSDMD
jgi:hypothetical protein